MLKRYFISLCVAFFPISAFSQTACDNALKSLVPGLVKPVSLDLKKAQELAEPFVNRKIASEVLADPGVEMAMEHISELDQLGALPFGQKEDKRQMVAEAIEEALLARGMSQAQAKKAANGWTKAMLDEGVLQNLVDAK